MDLVEKMSQITQVNIRMCICSLTDIETTPFQEKLATYTPKKQEEQTEEQRKIKEAILQVRPDLWDGGVSGDPHLQFNTVMKMGKTKQPSLCLILLWICPDVVM